MEENVGWHIILHKNYTFPVFSVRNFVQKLCIDVRICFSLCLDPGAPQKGGWGDISPPTFQKEEKIPPKCAKKFSFSCLRRLKTWLRPPQLFCCGGATGLHRYKNVYFQSFNHVPRFVSECKANIWSNMAFKQRIREFT